MDLLNGKGSNVLGNNLLGNMDGRGSMGA